MRYLVLCIGVALLLQSCPTATCKLIEQDFSQKIPKGTRLLKVVVGDNFQPCVNFEVKISNSLSGYTNDLGVAIIPVPKAQLKNGVKIRVINKLFDVDKSYVFTSESLLDCVQEIVVPGSLRQQFNHKINQSNDTLSSIEKDIDLLDKHLKRIYDRLTVYLNEHPGHVATEYLQSMEGYQDVIKTIQSNVKIIRKRLIEMKNDPSIKIQQEWVVDFTHAESKRREIESLISGIDNVVSDLSVETRSQVLDSLLQKIPVYFQSGEFVIPQLDERSQRILSGLPKKINDYFNKQQTELEGTKLKFCIKVAGFCDGVPVSGELNTKIQPLCSYAVYDHKILNPKQDGNNCLSWLRAESIYKFLKGKFPLGVVEQSVGFGSQKAKPNVSDFFRRVVEVTYLATDYILVTSPVSQEKVVFPSEK